MKYARHIISNSEIIGAPAYSIYIESDKIAVRLLDFAETQENALNVSNLYTTGRLKTENAVYVGDDKYYKISHEYLLDKTSDE